MALFCLHNLTHQFKRVWIRVSGRGDKIWSQATAFSYKLLSPTGPCGMSLQSVAYCIPTSKNILVLSSKLCLIAPASCKNFLIVSPLPPPPEQKPPYYPTFCTEGTTGISVVQKILVIEKKLFFSISLYFSNFMTAADVIATTSIMLKEFNDHFDR